MALEDKKTRGAVNQGDGRMEGMLGAMPLLMVNSVQIAQNPY